MSGKFALIIGNTEYIDAGLSQLTAPGKDAEDFARILKDPTICAFDDVKVLANELSSTVIEKIDEFFDQKKPDDMLVLYFSGHGVRDEGGSLYLAFKNTIRSRLRSTAVKSDYIREAMDQSRSKRQVLILDCCNSGAFAQGTKAEIGGVMGLTQAFQGYGRFVLTASDATQFAWEGDKVIGSTDNSLFTHFLLKGLEGEADSDGDGRITVDELYDYAYEQVSRVTPKQTPTKSAAKVEGEFVLRQNMRIEDIKPVALPDDLLSELEDIRPLVREGAVQRLIRILNGKNIGLQRSAIEALEKINADENTTRRVAQLATQALESYRQVEQKVEAERKAKEEAERLAILKAEEERLAREKAEAERKAKEEAERLLRAKAEHEAAEREAARLKAEREVAELAAREAADKAAKEKEEKEVADRAAAHKAEREAMELAARKKVEREQAERAEREAMELAARRKAEREAKEKVVGVESTKPAWLKYGVIGGVIISLCLCGYGAIRLFPSFFGGLATPAATLSPATQPPVTEVPVTELPATEQPISVVTNPPTITLVPTLAQTLTAQELISSNLFSEWPMENHDAARTGYNSDEHYLFPPLRRLWNKSLNDYYIDNISVSDGKIALSGNGAGSTNQVYMLDAATGNVLWDFTLPGGGGGAMSNTPAFGGNNIFFGGQGDKNIYALDVNTGQVSWQHAGFSGLYASQIVTTTDRLYVPDEINGVVAFDPNTGEPLWGNGTGGWGLPTALRNGIVFGVTSDRKTLVALNDTDGTQVWQFPSLQANFTRIVTDANQIYLNVSDTKVMSLSISNGTVLWETNLNVNDIGSGAKGAALMDGQLYIPVWKDNQGNGSIIALDTNTGKTLWTFSSGAEGITGIATANRVIYAVGWKSSAVYALSPTDGSAIWSYPLDCNGGDLAVAHGILFVTACGNIYAFTNQN